MPGRLEKWDQLVEQAETQLVEEVKKNLGITGDYKDLDELMKADEIKKNKERQRASKEAQKRTL